MAGLTLSFLTVALAIPAVTYADYRVAEELVAFVLLIRKQRGRDTGRVASA